MRNDLSFIQRFHRLIQLHELSGSLQLAKSHQDIPKERFERFSRPQQLTKGKRYDKTYESIQMLAKFWCKQ